jgi:tetratricopeptide (TPR) repeat protein
MIDPVRILRPLEDERAAIDRLSSYESPEDLAAALGATWAAVERTLRQLLRDDPGVPDDLRMSALSQVELPVDRLIAALSRRDLVSLRLAGLLHEFERIARQAEGGAVRAADADTAAAAVAQLRSEVGVGAVASAVEAPRPAEAGAAESGGVVERGQRRGRLGWVLLIVLAAAGLASVMLLRRGDDRQAAIRAFQAGELGEAESGFRRSLEEDPSDITARLYLGRIFRTQGRFDEAADMLHEASRIAPRDPGVRRELGHLFLDLARPRAAAEQFRVAQEIEPENKLNWIGLIVALRAAGDPEAEDVLRRAPGDVRAELTSRSPGPDTL